jgi:hypothetical protein
MGLAINVSARDPAMLQLVSKVQTVLQQSSCRSKMLMRMRKTDKDLNVVLFALKTSELPSKSKLVGWKICIKERVDGVVLSDLKESLDDFETVEYGCGCEQQLHQQCFRQEETKAGNKTRQTKVKNFKLCFVDDGCTG